MAAALIYLLSNDSEIVETIRQTPDFIVQVFSSSADLAVAAKRRPPDIFVLDFDADIPSCDTYKPALGIAKCQTLIPHEHVQGFLIKTHDSEVVRDWLLSHEKLIGQQRDAEKMLSESIKTAMAAMSSMGEIGIVMRFLNEAFMTDDFQDLARSIVNACSEFGLESAASICIPGRTYVAAKNDRRDEETFLTMRALGRIVEFRQKMIVNYEYVSLLVHDMPDDENVRGRMRDNLAFLAEGANERIKAMLLLEQNTNVKKGIQRALIDMRGTLTEAKAQAATHPDNVKHLISSAINELQCAFVHLTLPAEHENAMLEPLLTLRESYEVESSGFVLDKRLSQVINTLEEIIAK